jgi:ABC-type nitrate/sulfonate/bicarbonate transport system permease component
MRMLQSLDLAGAVSTRVSAASRPTKWRARPWVPRVVGLGTLVCLLVVLEGLCAAGRVNPFLVPAPSTIIASFPMLLVEHHLPQRFASTIAKVCAAALLAVLLGGFLGWAFYRSRNMRLAFRSWVVGLNASPSILLYPLFLIIFGRGAGTIVALGVISALPPIVLKTSEGLLATRRVLLDVGRSFNLTAVQQFRLVQFPAALPIIFTGVRIGLIYAVITVVGVEYLLAYGGLGELVPDLADRFEIPAMYAAIIFVILVSAGFQFVVQKVERWLQSV